jgi:hypothetical protein
MADTLPIGPNGLPLPHLGDSNFEGMRVFIVTLKNYEDNDGFYKDMEYNGGPLHIPQRVVECVDYKIDERNSDWLLTHDEAVALTFDPRVGAVELNPDDLGFKIIRQNWISTGTFTKSIALTTSDINWGLYRTRSKANTAGWGVGGSSNSLSSRTIISDSSGKNVDAVIIDGGLPYPVTLEYAQNPDGTGYPRMIMYNWSDIYAYTGWANGHQAHTSGTVGGNKQGFARDANIYNATFNDSGNGITGVKTFHQDKTVNPVTGVKNPTVTNNSWGYGTNIPDYSTLKAYCSLVVFRGVSHSPSSGSLGNYVWNDTLFQSFGIPTQFGNGFPGRSAATDANFIDAAKVGVINVVSAGNSFFYIAPPSSDPNADYNNYLIYNGSTYYYHRGSSPGAADNVINGDYSLDYSPILVGSMGTVVTGTLTANVIDYVYGTTSTNGILAQDYKSEFSNYGPRVDVFAPGEVVLSVIDSTSYVSGTINDPRTQSVYGQANTSFDTLGRDAGTSMSGPHVCGVLAAILEKFPRMTHPEARAWITATSFSNLVTTNGGPNDGTDSGASWSSSSTQRILFLPGTRVREAEVGGFFPTPYPITGYKYRRPNGSVYPRINSLNSRNNQATFALSVDHSTVAAGNTATITLTTTNISDGTKVPYIISGRMYNVLTTYDFNNTKLLLGSSSSGTTYSYSGFTGVASSSTQLTGSITGFSPIPYTGHRLTTGSGVGTHSTITNSVLGAASLTASTTPSIGNSDDGYWSLNLPFNISFNGISYSGIYVGTNGYITFGAGSTAFAAIGITNPPYPKICISANDNSTQRIYYGTEGSAPNRTYRVRVEGHNSPGGGVLGSPDMLYEAVFYENSPAQFDIQIGSNSRATLNQNISLTGNFTVNNNTATIALSPILTTQYEIYVTTNMFPTTSTSFLTNV